MGPCKLHSLERLYNAVQYNMISLLQQQKQNINQMNPQSTPHISPWRASYMRVFRGYLGEHWPRYNGFAQRTTLTERLDVVLCDESLV